MCLVEHILEYSVIAVGVRRRDFVGEERRRVQELHVGLDWGPVKVVGVGLKTCGEGERVSRVPYSRWAECAGCLRTSGAGRRRKGAWGSAGNRQGESRWEETLRWPWPCRCGEKLITWTTVRVQMMWHCATDETMRTTLMWVSVEVVVGVRIVQCHAIKDVVIGVRVMLCHQAISCSIHYYEFSTSCCQTVSIEHHFAL